MLRAVRFAGQLKDFQIERETAEAIRRQAGRITEISTERILEEFKKLFPSAGRVNGLRLADELGLLQHILPEVTSLHGTPGGSFSIGFHSDLSTKLAFEQTLAILDQLPEGCRFEVVMAGLLHEVGFAQGTILRVPDEIRARMNMGLLHASAKMADAICRRLTCSNQERMEIVWLVQLLPLFSRGKDLTLAQMRYGAYYLAASVSIITLSVIYSAVVVAVYYGILADRCKQKIAAWIFWILYAAIMLAAAAAEGFDEANLNNLLFLNVIFFNLIRYYQTFCIFIIRCLFVQIAVYQAGSGISRKGC
jgi:hypothetical protein